jgi:hypothetical protein
VGQGSPLRDLCLGMDILAVSVVTDVYLSPVTRQLGAGSSMGSSGVAFSIDMPPPARHER